MVGDGGREHVYFVSVKGNVVLVATDAALAYGYWRSLASTRVETTLEDRKIGTIADAGYLNEEEPTRWEVTDMSKHFGIRE
jgi:hypothetical protein